ncbi:MAG: hypothetical protein R3208_21305 [Ketobacteraceae bacterium]|nr:hypothetical protein [Ketobacteraceae bacterium]
MKLRVLLLLLALTVTLQVSARAETETSEQVEAVSAPVSIPKVEGTESRQQARKELQKLLDNTLHFATDELYRKATFYPFLVGMTESGKLELIGVPASEDRPAPKTTIKALRKAAEQLARKNRYKAFALYVDFVAERKDTAIRQSGIRVELQHQFPDALSVFIPYFIHDNNQISLMTPQFMPAKPTFFNHQ